MQSPHRTPNSASTQGPASDYGQKAPQPEPAQHHSPPQQTAHLPRRSTTAENALLHRAGLLFTLTSQGEQRLGETIFREGPGAPKRSGSPASGLRHRRLVFGLAQINAQQNFFQQIAREDSHEGVMDQLVPALVVNQQKRQQETSPQAQLQKNPGAVSFSPATAHHSAVSMCFSPGSRIVLQTPVLATGLL